MVDGPPFLLRRVLSLLSFAAIAKDRWRKNDVSTGVVSVRLVLLFVLAVSRLVGINEYVLRGAGLVAAVSMISSKKNSSRTRS